MPLPLREYYPIERAAELLECTVDDLLHWGENGRIRLCLMLHKVNAFCYLDFSIFEEIINDFNLPLTEKNNKSNRFIESYYTVHEYYKNNGLDFIEKLSCKVYYDVAFMLLTGCAHKGVRVKHIDNIHNKKWSFEIIPNYIKDYVSGVDADFEYIIKIPIELEGFFPLCKKFYTFRKWGVISDTEKTNYAFISFLDFSSRLFVIESLEFCINDLFVLKDDFIKIMNASKKGSELAKMPGYESFIICDEENNNNDKLSTNVRNSATARLIAKALIIKNHPEIKDNPVKLAAVLEREIKEAGLGDVSVSKDTVSRWMKED
ncbi:hypothetical protein DRD92_09515 [Salmonella enterica subsp. enterica serovar Newport]|nr:hypothetical protein [Salmonella enterica subsp. enterica serovar Newport]